MKAIKPIRSRFFSISAMLALASGNIGFIIFPMNEVRSSIAINPKTTMTIPPSSLGK